MTHRLIDPCAVDIPRNSGLPDCLFIPVAARDTNAIEIYVGRIVARLGGSTPKDAFLVEAHETTNADVRLPIWDLPQAAIFHHATKVWVHVDYDGYRGAYQSAFPDVDLTDLVLDHVMNRRVARLKRFGYLRIVPISRATNSSHGALSEDWGVKYHSTPRMMALNAASLAAVQYADLSDIVKMLNVPGGGSLMDNVNEAQKLVQPAK